MAFKNTVSTKNLSLMTCRVLENMGYGDKDVEYRINQWEIINHLGHQANILDLSGLGIPSKVVLTWRIAGSKITGLSTMFEGDIDLMFYLQGLLDFENPDKDLLGENVNVEIEYIDSLPGYCKLKMNEQDKLYGRKKKSITSKGFIPKMRKRYISSSVIKSTIMKECEQHCKQVGQTIGENGPALTILHSGRQNTDLVVCISSKTMPDVFINRLKRRRIWPGIDLISDIINLCCEIVPSGFPGEAEDPFLWRFSFSEAEQLLIKTFNGAQRKTYILLKRFLKEVVNRKFPNRVLTSYVAKLQIFWMIEQSPEKYWKEERLVKRFLVALQLLKKSLDNGYFPHYFVEDRNMFYRMTTKAKKCLSRALRTYIKEGHNCLFKVQSLYKELIGFTLFNWGMYDAYYQDMNKRLKLEKSSVMYIVISTVLCVSQYITYYKEVNWLVTFQLDRNNAKMRIINQFIKDEYSAGKLLIIIARKLKRYDFVGFRPVNGIEKLKRDRRKLMKNKNMATVHGKVISAVVAYAMGQYEMVYDELERTISSVESNADNRITINSRGIYMHEGNSNIASTDTLETLLYDDCLFEIIFNIDTTLLLHSGLRYLRYAPCFNTDPKMTGNVNYIRIDCMALAYYLYALVADEIGKKKEADEAIRKLLVGAMGKCDHHSLNFEYRETALNMACHFMMRRGHYHYAFKIARFSIILAIKHGLSPYAGIFLMATLQSKCLKKKTNSNGSD